MIVLPTLFKEGALAFGTSNLNHTTTLIDIKNEYKRCSIARAVLSAATAVSIVALAVFTTGGNSVIISKVGYAASVIAGVISAQQCFDIYKNNQLKSKFKADQSINLDMIR